MSQNISLNLYTVQNPLPGKVVESKRLTAESRGIKSEVRHITIRYQGKYPYFPGQSAGIIPPGTDARTGKPHKLRLYSVASAGAGDQGDYQTVSLCVVRHFWDDAGAGRKDVAGMCSNYLCDLREGDEVRMTGPVGRHFLLPEDVKTRDLIFVATGTGIAPYRGMLKELFDAGYAGRVSLYFGAQHADTVLYDGEFQAYRRHANFSYIKAISREQANPIPNEVPTRQNRMYVQVRLYEHRGDIQETLRKPDSMIYLCGLKGMEAGIFPVLEKMAAELGADGSLVAKLKAEQRLRVEVY